MNIIDTNKKDEKIPNSLIIYIKTRIPNFSKVNYEPYMSDPKNKSHTVYFDPIIKYYEGPIKNIPYGAPKDTLITQFFQASEFDSMINRILSDFRYMQKPITFKQANDEKIIENNLRITLKQLFKTNNLFYINKKPYTIVDVKYNTNDWQIDKKPLEKLLGQFSNLSANQLEEEAKKEEDNIPEILRQGNLASSNIVNNETTSIVSAGLKKETEKHDNTALQQEVAGITNSFVTQNELPGVSGDMLDLYTKYLRQNIPINYSNNSDLARDPLTLSLLIDPNDLLNFINENKKSIIIDLYSAFTNSKINLQQADKLYIDLCIEFVKYKTNFDNQIKIIRKVFLTNISKQKKETTNLIINITKLKVGYMEIIFKIADSINQIYKLQNVYFMATKELLNGLKDDYVNIIQYYEKPELALKCIDNDIAALNSLIEKDPENPYSVSYYTNYNKFKQFYDDQLYKNRQQLLEPQANFDDESQIYINQPYVLLVEKDQYEIYNFKLLLSYSYNQFDVWVVWFKSIESFVTSLGKIVSNIVSIADLSITTLNDNYTLDQQNNYLKKIGMEGIRATYDNKTKQLIWFLVKGDGKRAIDINSKKSLDTSFDTSLYTSFEELYINYIKTNVKAYDAIILYIYLLEIMCLRQNRVYVAEENINQLNIEYSLTLELYYNTLIKNINSIKTGTTAYIPSSMLWDISNLNNIDFIEFKKNINSKSNVIYRAKLKSISESRNNLVSSCETISNIITPNISKSGFIKQCNNIVTSQISNITQHTFRSSYWIDKTIKNYDIQDTNDFIYNMNKTVKDAWYDRIIDDIDVKYYLDWMVFDNDSADTNDIDSLYNVVAQGLNRQLEIINSETTNPYTENIDGKQMFTAKTIKQLFFDNKNYNDANNDVNIIRILEKVLKIKFIIFEMFHHNLPISIGDMVLYKRRPYRVLSIREEYNVKSNKNTFFYNLYNGYTEIRDVSQKKIKVNPNNLLQNFRIFCDYDAEHEQIIFNDYMYIVLSKYDNEETQQNVEKFKLVHNTNTTYIFTQDKIPIYIKYLIFNSCPNINIDKLLKMGFNNDKLIKDILEFETIRRRHIKEENILYDIDNINRKIEKYNVEYKILKSITDKSLEEQAEELLYKEEIKDLKQRRIMLNEFLSKQNDKIKENDSVNPNIVETQSYLGGENKLKPSKQYSSYMPPNNPIGYQLNTNIPGNVIYLPRQNYPYQNYPYQNSYYSKQYNVPYSVAQNKSKDQKSKLSFYITIELELFPGTSANMFQKSVVKCQSTFERIR